MIKQKDIDEITAAANKILEKRCQFILLKSPEILIGLRKIRQQGKMELTTDQVTDLLTLGILDMDKDGVFLSETAENAIDIYEDVLKEHGIQ